MKLIGNLPVMPLVGLFAVVALTSCATPNNQHSNAIRYEKKEPLTRGFHPGKRVYPRTVERSIEKVSEIKAPTPPKRGFHPSRRYRH